MTFTEMILCKKLSHFQIDLVLQLISAFPDKENYLEIVRSLANEKGLEIDIETLENEAEQWALERGGRSPRCAKQFVAIAEARQLKNN